MCLILFSISEGDNELVVAANRDEFHARPTLSANHWIQDPNVIGGIDLEAGGTWLGLTKSGRFAAVTNFAEPPKTPIPPRSRGALTSEFLRGDSDPEAYLREVNKQADQYRGFNLIISSGGSTWYYSNRDRNIRQLLPGVYGLSNQLLDCDWPKVVLARQELLSLSAHSFKADTLFELLAHRGDDRHHSARFIVGETYGTSACTVVRINKKGYFFEERNFDPRGELKESNQFNFDFD
ncbi:MAG: NRDE family protein [Pseudomonadales bacterium]|nr:NRDE family protein [Pseudomonadales bacterium]